MTFIRKLMKQMKYDVIVIGGGPAGMMASYYAAKTDPNAKILLFEKNEQLGRKLRITGKGRCNITNDCDEKTFLNNIPQNSKFLYSSINQYNTQDAKDFFIANGVPIKTERGNRVFPVSDKADDVADAMIKACTSAGVKIIKSDVTDIIFDDGQIKGVKTKTGDFACDKIVLATGGRCYPKTGSDGKGYKLAQKLGHNITKITPSLIPIISNGDDCSDMQGLSLKNVTVSLFDNQSKKNKPLYNELGEMLFTHYGMSGPLILSASSHIRTFEKDRYTIKIDLKPGLDLKALDNRILKDFSEFQNKDFFNSLGKLLPKKMIPIIIKRSEIPPLTKVNVITKEQRKKLCESIKELSFPVDDFRSIDEAIITSGGIPVKEINPKTMESKIVEGLYFTGEIIDVDAYTGGFNLQIAYSTGYVAGINCVALKDEVEGEW